jgi:hypothetical protein
LLSLTQELTLEIKIKFSFIYEFSLLKFVIFQFYSTNRNNSMQSMW